MRERTGSRSAAVVAGLVAIMALGMLTGAAHAQVDPYGNGEPDVLPTIISRGGPDEPRPIVGGDIFRSEPEVEGGVLPFTGGDVTVFLVIAFVLVGAGTLIVRRRRAERQDTTG
jgi:LPXTG-motif cell wall-anchored protein